MAKDNKPTLKYNDKTSIIIDEERSKSVLNGDEFVDWNFEEPDLEELYDDVKEWKESLKEWQKKLKKLVNKASDATIKNAGITLKEFVKHSYCQLSRRGGDIGFCLRIISFEGNFDGYIPFKEIIDEQTNGVVIGSEFKRDWADFLEEQAKRLRKAAKEDEPIEKEEDREKKNIEYKEKLAKKENSK